MSLEQDALERAKVWTKDPYDTSTREEVKQLIEEGGEALIDAFYKDLDFGTGGLRGKMGSGTNRVNRYTLGMATQGLSNYLKEQFDGKIKVAIAHDSRNNSHTFAAQVAQVLAANDIKVYLFEELRPTPELSFAIRHLNCQSGIVITASHNPPEYNGYKVYWEDGGQLIPPHDKAVIDRVRKVKPEEVKFTGGEKSSIEKIGREIDEAYLEEIKKLSFSDAGKKDLKIVFTPIHGTSIKLMPAALEACGFKNVDIVKEQADPNGDFPTVESPNPEEAEALSMAVKKAKDTNADLVIGTDPDADRVGIAVRDLDNEMVLLNGNQAASVLLYYLLEKWHEGGQLTGKEFIAKTIVTTNLIDEMAKHYKVKCYNVLTGFKWIADIIRKKEGELKFIGGGEESYGYMVGDFVRDKDAIASGVMIAEAAAWAKSRGSSFYELLIEVYEKFGFYLESLVSMKKEGHQGASEIEQMMKEFRLSAPTTMAGEKLVKMLDYQSSVIKNLNDGSEETMDLPKSNVVQFITESNSVITARPSGTEPKIKFYISVNTPLENKDQFKLAKAGLESRITAIKSDLGL